MSPTSTPVPNPRIRRLAVFVPLAPAPDKG
jgi:hypothetical protein